MSTISSVQGGSTPTPLQQSKLVEDSPAEEKTEGPGKKAAEAQAAQTAKRLKKKHRKHPGQIAQTQQTKPPTAADHAAAAAAAGPPKAVDVRA